MSKTEEAVEKMLQAIIVEQEVSIIHTQTKLDLLTKELNRDREKHDRATQILTLWKSALAEERDDENNNLS